MVSLEIRKQASHGSTIKQQKPKTWDTEDTTMAQEVQLEHIQKFCSTPLC